MRESSRALFRFNQFSQNSKNVNKYPLVVGIRNVILFENLKFTCHQAFMSLESSMSLKKLIFVSLTEDDRSESLMAFSEDLTGQLWKEKGTQRCLCQKYYLIPEQPLDWPLLHSLETVLGSEYICPLIHSLLRFSKIKLYAVSANILSI